MRINDSIKIVLRNLGRSRTRTILTSIGVLIGVAAIVTLISISIALNRSVVEQIESSGDIKVVTVFPSSINLEEMQNMTIRNIDSTIKILDKENLEKIEKIDGIEAMSPVFEFNNLKFELGKGYSVASLTGLSPNKIKYISGELEKGRYFTNSDKYSVIVGAKFGENFLDKNTNKKLEVDTYGKNLKVTLQRFINGEIEKKSYTFKVVGILKSKGSMEDYNVYAPINTVISMREWMSNSSINPDVTGYSRVIVKVKDVNSVEYVSEKIQDIGFTAISVQTIIKAISNVFIILQFILGGIAGISLIVAGVGIVNTMTMSIYERTRQIGIMKSIGASNGDILTMFLLEAASLGFFGGIGGVLLSYLLNFIITLISPYMMQGLKINVVAPFYLVIFAIIFAITIGIVAGYFPSKRAANLSPVEALRYE